MIVAKNGGRIVETAAELPDFSNALRLYLDFETVSFDPRLGGNNPWQGHRICGAAITADDHEHAYYVPVRHLNTDGNIPIEVFQRWLKDQVETCKNWVNHNVKFDAHFADADGALFQGRLVDTLTLSKLLDSDRMYKGGYGLKALSTAWLEEDIIDKQDAVKLFLSSIKLPRNAKAKDYGLVPIDIMGEYACQDVITNRRLDWYLERRKPEDMASVWETEILLTPVLFDIEKEGMRVDPQELLKEEYKRTRFLIRTEEELHNDLGFVVNPSTNAGCYEAIVNHFGLPVLAYNDSGNPSFDKNALKQYLVHPDVEADERKHRIIDKILAYRKQDTILNFFVRPYQEHEVEGILHPDYNQSVRSGRMSCKRPNAQQLNKDAKMLIHPKDGNAFLCCDYRQIEFRLIVHYIRDIACIESYAADPETDFHTWVAEMCGIPRKPAKNVNFAIGFGAGKKKVTNMLAANMDLMAGFTHEIDARIAAGDIHESERKDKFDAMCQARAEEVYWKYHETLPGLRLTTRQCARKIESRGYVRNAYGRRAHLDAKAAHIAFNRLIQGCAADVMKERTVAVSPRYNSQVRDLGIKLCWSVHDETGFTGEAELMKDPRTISLLTSILEDTTANFRVPIRTSAGYSAENWAIASGDEGEVEIPRNA